MTRGMLKAVVVLYSVTCAKEVKENARRSTAARAMLKAVALIRTLRPCAVLSVGGYAAGPMAMAAVLRGIPVSPRPEPVFLPGTP